MSACAVQSFLPLRRSVYFLIVDMSKEHPFQWNAQLNTAFIECALDVHTTYQKKSGMYKRIAEVFTSRTDIVLTDNQAKNKWDNLRRSWANWDKLLQVHGAEWDNEKDTISADDAWWTERQKEFGGFIIKYKERPLPNWRMLDNLFQGCVGTGSCAFTPAAATHIREGSDTEGLDCSEVDDKILVKLSNNYDQMIEKDVPEIQTTPVSLPQNATKVPQTECSRATATATTCRSRRRSHNEIDGKLDRLIDLMTERHVRACYGSQEEAVASTGPTFKESMERCKKLSGDYRPYEIVDILLDSAKRMAISCLEDDDARAYLETAVRKSRG